MGHVSIGVEVHRNTNGETQFSREIKDQYTYDEIGTLLVLVQ